MPTTMSAPVLERPAPSTAADRQDTTQTPRPWRLLLLGCLALATLSLLLPSVPTYDPWAWIIWGREILHGDLVTTTGPSWKPLPVVFTTPFSLLGDTGAPLAWLAIARAGGILAFAMAYRLGSRLAGPVAGVIAALALILADNFIFDFARGNSEGILVAVCLWAIERHVDGHRRAAFGLLYLAGLLRPEVWPFIALYGVYLLYVERRRSTLALLAAGALGMAILWFLPEYLGSGDFLRAAARARQPNPDSAAFAKYPFLDVFGRSASVLTPPIYLGGAIATIAAVRSRHSLFLAMAVIGTVLMVAVAAMTQFGFAGNLRYVALPAALVCVLAGAGWVTLARATHARFGTPAAVGLIVVALGFAYPFVASDVGELRQNATDVKKEADLYGSVPGAIKAAGGVAELKACGTVYTGAFQTQTVAWYMHLHEMDTEIFASPPGTTITPWYTALSHDPRFPARARTKLWVIGSSCQR